MQQHTQYTAYRNVVVLFFFVLFVNNTTSREIAVGGCGEGQQLAVAEGEGPQLGR